MTPTARRSTRALWQLFLLLTASLLLTTLGIVAPAQAEEKPLEITGLSPEIYPGDSAVTITVAVPEQAREAGKTWVVEAFLQPAPFTSLERYEDFIDSDDFPGWRIYSGSADSSALSSQGILKVTVPAAEMPRLDPRTAGSRGLVVRLTAGETTFEARGAIIYQPQEQAVKTDVSLTVLSPVTADFFPDAAGKGGDPELAEQVKTVEALAGVEGVSLAVLPDFFRGLTETSSARELFPLLKKHQDLVLANDLELISLPEQNADLSLLAATSQPRLLALAESTRVAESQLSGQAWEQARVTLADNIIFASDEGFTQTALASLWGSVIVAPPTWADNDSVMAGSSTEAESADAGTASAVTPTSRMSIAVDTGLLAPQGNTLTATVLDQWSPITELLNRPVGSAAEELELRQTLRTASLLVGLEDPTDLRTLSVTLNVSRETLGPEVVERAKALLGNSWVDPVSLSQVIEGPESVVPRPAVSANTPDNNAALRDAEEQFSTLSSEYFRAQSIAASTTAGSYLLAPASSAVLKPLAQGLTAGERQLLIEDATTMLTDLTDVVKVVPISMLNVVSTEAEFPVSISNSGSVPITLVVSLIPSDPRLQSHETVNVTVPADGQKDVTIPVTAVGSGDIEVRVQVGTLDETILDNSQVVTVRVRANWEDTGTVVAAGALSLLFFFGIIRTIRKSRRRSSAPPDPAPAPTKEEIA